MGFGAKHTKQQVSGLATLSKCLCALAEGHRREKEAMSSFVPREAVLPLSDALQEDGMVSPSVS